VDAARLFSGWSCPRCGTTPLVTSDDAYVCERCDRRYPLFGGLPCLVPDPDIYRGVWSSRLNHYRGVVHARKIALELEATRPHLLDRTRARVRRVAEALAADLGVIEELFRPLVPQGYGAPPAVDVSGAEGRSPVLDCYEHLFRDWIWGESESRSALELVRALSPQAGPRAVVLGVGTGRLAADMQRELGLEFTLGIDNNPLPLLAFEALSRGRALDLCEYPVAPNSADEVAIRRRLTLPFPIPNGLHVALGDALAPPIAPASVDLVVTPWLIDATGSDPRVTARAVARLLPPGGIWANFGPLRFTGSVSSALSVEEVHEVVGASGFELVQQFRRDLPYFDSPHSGSRRTDTVFAFAARRSDRTPELAVPNDRAPWLADPQLPIPQHPVFASERDRSVVIAGVLSLVDGNRSIRDLATMLASQWRADPGVIETQLVALLSRFGGA
jgi:hypothetical protein